MQSDFTPHKIKSCWYTGTVCNNFCMFQFHIMVNYHWVIGQFTSFLYTNHHFLSPYGIPGLISHHFLLCCPPSQQNSSPCKPSAAQKALPRAPNNLNRVCHRLILHLHSISSAVTDAVFIKSFRTFSITLFLLNCSTHFKTFMSFFLPLKL